MASSGRWNRRNSQFCLRHKRVSAVQFVARPAHQVDRELKRRNQVQCAHPYARGPHAGRMRGAVGRQDLGELERLAVLLEESVLKLVRGHHDRGGDVVLGLELAAREEVLAERERLPRRVQGLGLLGLHRRALVR